MGALRGNTLHEQARAAVSAPTSYGDELLRALDADDFCKTIRNRFWRRCNLVDEAFQFFARHGLKFELRLLKFGDEGGVLHGGVKSLAQGLDSLRRNARRSEDGTADHRGRREKPKYGAVLRIGGEVVEQRHVLKVRRLGEADLHEDVDLLLLQPLGSGRFPRRPAITA